MALHVSIKVIPCSDKFQWQLNKNGQIKCFLKSIPEKGAANKELIKKTAKLIKMRQDDIEIIKGLINQKKEIKIHSDITLEEFLRRVGIEYQLNLLI